MVLHGGSSDDRGNPPDDAAAKSLTTLANRYGGHEEILGKWKERSCADLRNGPEEPSSKVLSAERRGPSS